ncbi:hypothetical protein [Tolypothrix sp. VBCCA 56010]|uniref:hypothetical protein n=1 Tax=Tolypothrix sp. VBCCA 56010 TaxID=3137731 RepID=UPI003D7D93A3
MHNLIGCFKEAKSGCVTVSVRPTFKEAIAQARGESPGALNIPAGQAHHSIANKYL